MTTLGLDGWLPEKGESKAFASRHSPKIFHQEVSISSFFSRRPSGEDLIFTSEPARAALFGFSCKALTPARKYLINSALLWCRRALKSR
jgi:hypothetical protein